MVNWKAGMRITASRLNSMEGSHARYYKTTSQTISNATDTKLVFDTALDTTGDITATGGYDTFEFTRAGVWAIYASVRWNTASGEKYVAISDADDTQLRFSDDNNGDANAGSQSASASRRFSAGDRVCALVFQDTGASLDAVSSFTEVASISFDWLRA